MMWSMSEQHIYADGSFDATTHSGGWAFVIMEAEVHIYEDAGTTLGSSNNTLEFLSVVKAASWLEAEAPSSAAVIWTDSAHVVDGCNRWRFIWRARR
jgi:ribonuclease HI